MADIEELHGCDEELEPPHLPLVHLSKLEQCTHYQKINVKAIVRCVSPEEPPADCNRRQIDFIDEQGNLVDAVVWGPIASSTQWQSNIAVTFVQVQVRRDSQWAPPTLKIAEFSGVLFGELVSAASPRKFHRAK